MDTQTIFKRVAHAVDVLRVEFPQINLTSFEFFSLICAKGEVGLKEIERSMGVPQSTTSRLVGLLSERDGGAGLVETLTDRTNPRMKVVRLTTKGMRVRNRLYEILTGG